MSAPLYYLERDFEAYRSQFLEATYRIIHYNAGDIILESHSKWDCIMYINTGKVKLSIQQNDREKLLAFYGDGYLIPYYSPESIEISHLLQFTAVTDVTVIKLTRQAFETLVNQNTDLQKSLYLSSWRLLHLLTHEVESQSLDTGLEKVATFLYTYFENTGHDQFEISTYDLQSFVGLNRTNLTKYLSFLSKAHVIEKKRGKIKIIAPEKLKNFCSERVINCDIIPSKYLIRDTLSLSEKWQAIQNKDASYDGVFWYGLKDQKLYVNPSCPDYQPHKDNIIYFCSLTEAQASGYKPSPSCEQDTFSYNPNRQLLMDVKATLDAHFAQGDYIKAYLDDLGLDQKYLNKLFKLQYDMTLHAYIQERRIEKAVQLISDTQMTILEIAMETGFNSLSNFYSVFKNHYDMTPNQYRKSEKA